MLRISDVTLFSSYIYAMFIHSKTGLNSCMGCPICLVAGQWLKLQYKEIYPLIIQTQNSNSMLNVWFSCTLCRFSQGSWCDTIHSWEKHHKAISSRAYRTLGLIRRTFIHNHLPTTLVKLYISLVRSQLLYCTQIWRPHLMKDIVNLERIQRRATKHILNDYTGSYKD